MYFFFFKRRHDRKTFIVNSKQHFIEAVIHFVNRSKSVQRRPIGVHELVIKHYYAILIIHPPSTLEKNYQVSKQLNRSRQFWKMIRNIIQYNP